MSVLRFLPRLVVVAAILLLGAVTLPSSGSAHAGHVGMDVASASEAVDDAIAAVFSVDESGPRLNKGCAGACCTVTCSIGCAGLGLGPCNAPSPLPDVAAIDIEIGHAQAPPDAPERHQTKPPRA